MRKVFKTLRDFGDHQQFSIFECQRMPIDLARFRAALSDIINHSQNQVLYVDLGPSAGRGDRVITSLGQA